MRSLLLGYLLLIGAWITAHVNELDWVWLQTTGFLILVLPLLVSLCIWKTSKKHQSESGGQQREKVTSHDKEIQTSASVESNGPGPVVGWLEVEEEREEGELSLLVLQDFYATQVYKGRREPPHDYCDMVTGLIDSLLKRVQTFGNCCQAVFQERCVGVGSMFEGWGVSRGDQVPVYDVMVIISPPAGFCLDVELGHEEEQLPSPQRQEPRTSSSSSLLPPPEHCSVTRVRVRADPAQSHVRSFATRSRLCDYVERVHVERIKEGLDYMLEECLTVNQHMEPARVLSWLGAALRRAWVFRGGTKLSFWGCEWPCVMRLESAAGRVLYVNVVAAVRVPESDACVVAHGLAAPPWQQHWEPWFCSDEDYFLRRVAHALPGNSCHTLCLEILAFLNRRLTPFSGRVATFLRSYHLKTVLLHLLLARPEPQAWEAACLAERLRDMLARLQRCLRDRRLPSFWVGNVALGEHFPKPFTSAAPLNLFGLLAQHQGWHELATLELKRLRARLRDLPRSASLDCLVPREAISPERAASSTATFVKQPSSVHYHSSKRPRTFKAVTKTLNLVAEHRASRTLAQSPLFRNVPHARW